MSRPATSRLKVNPPLGARPTLEWCRITDLSIDPAYQRSIQAANSQALIRRIAQFWDWNLCQPLAVARRVFGPLKVVDGQHRLAAARLRGDIDQLPCVIVAYANAGDEAAAFVALNQQRRPLTKLDLFKAALAAGDIEAAAVNKAITDAGLRLATSTNLDTIARGSISNIGGVLRYWRRSGEATVRAALASLAQAWRDEVLRYAGTVFPGLAAVVADELRLRAAPDAVVGELAALAGARSQAEWRKNIHAAVADAGGSRREAAELVFRRAWRARHNAPPTPVPLAPPQRQPSSTRSFSEQLAMVERGEATCSRKIPVRRPDPDRTLGGVTGEIM